MRELVMRQYRKLTKEADFQTQQLREKRGGSPCPAGCFECCRNTATMQISEVEAQDVKEGLKKLPREVQTYILGKAARSIRKLEQLGYSDKMLTTTVGMEAIEILKGKPEAECPMLVGGVCSIYEHRPVICRVWGYPIDNGNELACCHLTFIGQRRQFKPIDYAQYWKTCRELSAALGAKQKTPNCYLVARLLTEAEAIKR